MTDRVAHLAQWLTGHLEWMRHRAEADEFLADVESCARVVAGIARGPAEQKYLGPCGATYAVTLPRDGSLHEVVCDGDVYAPRTGSVGRCRTCGAEVASGEREAWLDAQARSHAFTARDIADAYGINVKTIRTWATRPRPGTGLPVLRSYYRTETGIVAEWIDVFDGEDPPERLYHVGDVLDLARADEVRRAEQQARRARRKDNAA